MFVASIINSVLNSIFKHTGLFMIIVLPLRKSSFRKMINERHNNRQISLTVLESLKPIVCDRHCSHGDLKEKCNSKNNKFQLILITRFSRKIS